MRSMKARVQNASEKMFSLQKDYSRSSFIFKKISVGSPETGRGVRFFISESRLLMQ